jgi:hypothetical protein
LYLAEHKDGPNYNRIPLPPLVEVPYVLEI